MREINLIVVHCSDTPDDRHVTASDIDRWHRERGFNSIGYHQVILRDATMEQGRPVEVAGAHVRGHNANSIGICLIGRHEFTENQMIMLEGLVRAYKSRWPQADVVGHCDLDPGKTCPNTNILEWWSNVRTHD